MSYFSLALMAIFTENALLGYAFGIRFASREGQSIPSLLAKSGILAILGAISAFLLRLCLDYALTPLGLDAFLPLVFLLILFPIGEFAVRTIPWARSRTALLFVFDDLDAGYLLSGIVITAVIKDASVSACAVVVIASAVGFFLSATLLRSILKRMELEPSPSFFQGIPVLLITIGLLSMTCHAFDMTFRWGGIR